MSSTYNFTREAGETLEAFRQRVIDELGAADMPPSVEDQVAAAIDADCEQLIVIREPSHAPWEVTSRKRWH